MDHKRIARVAAALCALALAGCSGGGLIGKPAADFSLPDLAGKKRSLSELKGQVVLLDFWATWCGPCQEELPDLKRLHQDFAKKGLTIIGVSMDTADASVVAEYVKENQIGYLILHAEGEPVAGYPIVGLPSAFLIDRNGIIVKQYRGAKDYPRLAKAVQELL